MTTVTAWSFEQIKEQALHPNPSVQLVDVRETSEHTYTPRHAPIPSSITIPMSSFDPGTAISKCSHADHLVFYCEAGVRAKRAADMVNEFGSGKTISYYPGSHKEWRQKSFE